MTITRASDQQILQELGVRIKAQRLRRNWTQAELAKESGIGQRTLSKMESGRTTTLATLIAVLRGLGLLKNLDELIPSPLPSPVEFAKQAGRTRKKASKRRKPQPATESGAEWKWAE